MSDLVNRGSNTRTKDADNSESNEFLRIVDGLLSATARIMKGKERNGKERKGKETKRKGDAAVVF